MYNALSLLKSWRTKDLEKCHDMMGINVATFETFLGKIQTNIDGWSYTRQPFSCSSKVELWYPLWFLHIVPTLVNVCYHHWQSMLWLTLPTWKVCLHFEFCIIVLKIKLTSYDALITWLGMNLTISKCLWCCRKHF
jgi:hypothetical protein